jgi:hypothetical protein
MYWIDQSFSLELILVPEYDWTKMISKTILYNNNSFSIFSYNNVH